MQPAIIKIMILGIDEVGRGPWAGPLVVGAVVWPNNTKLNGLTDSKKLTAKKRELLNNEILKLVPDYGIGEVSASELDEIGLGAALKLATKRAVDKISAPYDQIILDGTINFLKDTKYEAKTSTLAKADFLVPAVSAASIIAKVKRDNFMRKMSETYPHYGFEKNVGYGTKNHREAIKAYGVTPLHRLSFAPLAKYRCESRTRIAKNLYPYGISTKQIGDKAEDLVVNSLVKMGHIILSRNFKTKWCEIDIISLKNKTIYFTEVKYRNNNDFGGSASAVSTAKQRQMKCAAELFLNSGKIRANNIKDYTPQLAVGLVGNNFEIKDWFTLY